MAVGMTAVAIATFAFRWLSLTDLTNDHFDHVARAAQVLLGQWPVRDFVDPGLPLTYLMSAAAHALVGNPFVAEALLFGAGFAAAAALSFRAVTLATGSAAIALVAVTLQVASYPRTYSYPKLLVYAMAILVAWWAVDRPAASASGATSGPPAGPSPRRLAALAAITAVAYLFRHDHGVYVGIAALVLLIVDGWAAGPRHLAAICGRYIAFTVAFMLPHLAYVQWASGLRDYLTVAAAYSRTEAGVNAYVVPALAWPGTPQQSGAFLFWLGWAIPALAVLILARGRPLTALTGERAKIAMVVALAVCVNAALVRDPLLARLPDVAVPHTILGAWLLAALWRWPARPAVRLGARAVLAGSVAVIAIAVFLAFDAGERVTRTHLLRGPAATLTRWNAVTADLREDFPSVMSSTVEPLALFLDYVRQCTAPDDRLLYVGYEPQVYVLARRGFAGGHMMFFSGFHSTPEEQALTVQRLAAQRVPLVLVPSAGRDDFRRTFAQVSAYVEARYVPMTTIAADAGAIEVLMDAARGRPPLTDDSRDWPCLLTPLR
jgi:hypothetical protein